MRSETGFDPALYDRFPTEKRPDREIEELSEIWKAPTGWARLTAVNNNYVGFWYVVTAFGFFLARSRKSVFVFSPRPCPSRRPRRARAWATSWASSRRRWPASS